MSDSPSKICAVIAEATVDAARAALERATAVADIVELRLDYLRDVDFSRPESFAASLAALLNAKPLPLIVTFRAMDEGGQQPLEEEARLQLLAAAQTGGADYCDIEAAKYEGVAAAGLDPARLIVSYHNFTGTPADLPSIYDRLVQNRAAIHKIAVRARDIADSLALFKLLDRAVAEGRTLIAIAMEQAGVLTRILGPSRGSFLTYASVATGRESAPGQFTCADLRQLYRIGELTRDTQIVGIIGDPISHSASPLMHNRALREAGLNYVYIPMPVRNVGEFFTRFVRLPSREMRWQLRGFSVTVPHKTAVVPYLDELDRTAMRIGAVNTVVVEGERLLGYNTDAAGAVAPLAALTDLRDAHCAVAGAGGTARAVIFGLLERGAAVSLFGRNAEKTAPLAAQFGIAAYPLESLAAAAPDVIINTTPVGMSGHSEGESIVPASALGKCKIAYDVVYNPVETRFLKEARQAGCLALSGIEMLVGQATAQFELWTGQQAPVETMRAAALEKVTAMEP